MNNTFNIKRFGLVFRKDILEDWKRYLLLLLTMLGLLTLITYFQTASYYSNHDNSTDYSYLNKDLLKSFSLMFVGFGIWFASTFSTPMNSKLKRTSYLISPSSNLEKFLVRWIITTVGFIVAFFVSMWIADKLRVGICSVVYPEADIHFLDITKITSPKGTPYSRYDMIPREISVIFISLYFLFQSIFLLGSTFWEKVTFIKTFSFVALIISAFVLMVNGATRLFYAKFNEYMNVLNSFELGENRPTEQTITYAVIIISVFTLTFWILTFFRMKESEIIKRL